MGKPEAEPVLVTDKKKGKFTGRRVIYVERLLVQSKPLSIYICSTEAEFMNV
jgi:hypothetical protein